MALLKRAGAGPARPGLRSLLALAPAAIILVCTAACGDSPATSGAGRPLLPTRTPTAAPAAAFAGQLDPTFGDAGQVTTDFGSTNDEARAVAVQPDGKLVAAGVAWPEPDRLPKFALARYTAQGKLDPSFGDGGMVVTNLLGESYDYAEARALVLQPDGKIVVAGGAHNPAVGHTVFAVARYNADGSLDATFGDGGKVLTAVNQETYSSITDEAWAVALAPNGKIVVSGVSGAYPRDFAVVRYTKNGSLDTTFGAAGIVLTDFGDDDRSQAVAVQPDGKILAAGYAVQKADADVEHRDYALVRYNTDGSLDTAFGAGGRVRTDMQERHDEARAVVLLPDGKIVLGGPVAVGAHACTGSVCRTFGFGLARYTADGHLDAGFGAGGKAVHQFGTTSGNYALLRLPDGTLAAAGHISNDDFGLALYTADGALVESFAEDGHLTTAFGSDTDYAFALALQMDGKLVAAGTGVVDPDDVLNADFALVRYR
jgi:uncharacterized delta-60 repeat protein